MSIEKRSLIILIAIIILLTSISTPVMALSLKSGVSTKSLIGALDLESNRIKVLVKSSSDKKSAKHFEPQLGNFKDMRVDKDMKYLTYDDSGKDASMFGEVVSPENLYPPYFSSRVIEVEDEIPSGDFGSFPRSFGKDSEDRKIPDGGVMEYSSTGDFMPFTFPSKIISKKNMENSIGADESHRVELIASQLNDSLDILIKKVSGGKKLNRDEFLDLAEDIANLPYGGGILTVRGKPYSIKIGTPSGVAYDEKEAKSARAKKENYIFDTRDDNVYMFIWDGAESINSVPYGGLYSQIYAMPKGYQKVNEKVILETPYNNVNKTQYAEDTLYIHLGQMTKMALINYYGKGFTAGNIGNAQENEGVVETLGVTITNGINSASAKIGKDPREIFESGIYSGPMRLLEVLRPFMFLLFIMIVLSAFGMIFLKDSISLFSQNSGALASLMANIKNILWFGLATSTFIEFLYALVKLSHWVIDLFSSIGVGYTMFLGNSVIEALAGLIMSIAMLVIYVATLAGFLVAVILTIISPIYLFKDFIAQGNPSLKHHVRVGNYLLMGPMAYFGLGMIKLLADSLSLGIITSTLALVVALMMIMKEFSELTGGVLGTALGGAFGASIAGLGLASQGVGKVGGKVASNQSRKSAGSGTSTQSAGSASSSSQELRAGDTLGDNVEFDSNIKQNSANLDSATREYINGGDATISATPDHKASTLDNIQKTEKPKGFEKLGGDFNEYYGGGFEKFLFKADDTLTSIGKDIKTDFQIRTGGSDNMFKKAEAGLKMGASVGGKAVQATARQVSNVGNIATGSLKAVGGAMTGNMGQMGQGVEESFGGVGDIGQSALDTRSTVKGYSNDAYEHENYLRNLETTEGVKQYSQGESGFTVAEMDMNQWRMQGLTSMELAEVTIPSSVAGEKPTTAQNLNLNYDYASSSPEVKQQIANIVELDGTLEGKQHLRNMGINEVKYKHVLNEDNSQIIGKQFEGIRVNPKKSNQFMNINTMAPNKLDKNVMSVGRSYENIQKPIQYIPNFNIYNESLGKEKNAISSPQLNSGKMTEESNLIVPMDYGNINTQAN